VGASFRRVLGAVALFAALLASGTTAAIASAAAGVHLAYPEWWADHLDAIYLGGAFLGAVLGLGLALVARPGRGRWLLLASVVLTAVVRFDNVGASLYPLGTLLVLAGPLCLGEGLLVGTDLPRVIGWGVLASVALQALAVVAMGMSRGAAVGMQAREWIGVVRVVLDNLVLLALAWALLFDRRARANVPSRRLGEHREL